MQPMISSNWCEHLRPPLCSSTEQHQSFPWSFFLYFFFFITPSSPSFPAVKKRGGEVKPLLIPTMLNRPPEITRRKQAPWNKLPVERLSGLAADDAVGQAGVLDAQAIVAVVRSQASQQ